MSWPAHEAYLAAGCSLANYAMTQDLEARIGLIMLSVGVWLFVCLSEAPFALPVPRHRPRLPVRRWQPELG